MGRLQDLKTPFFIPHAENDFPHVIATSKAMHAALKDLSCPVSYHVFPALDHYDNNLSQGVRSNVWVETARQWMTELPPKN